jgi:hypothetical protein
MANIFVDSNSYNLTFQPTQRLQQNVLIGAGVGNTSHLNISSTQTVFNKDVKCKGDIYVSGDVLPTQDAVFDIGSSNMRFRDLYIKSSTLHLGSTKVSALSNQTLVVKDATNTTKDILLSEVQIGSSNPFTIKASISGDVQVKTTAKPYAAGYDIIVLMGQDNMIGMDLISAKQNIIDPRIKQLGYFGAYNNMVITASNQLHHIMSSGTNKVGPGMMFAQRYLQGVNLPVSREVLLVPCAQSNSGFSDGKWVPGTGSLYTTAVQRTKIALAYDDVLNPFPQYSSNAPPPANINNKVVAVLWLQGERDVGAYTSNQYAAQLSNLVTSFRNEIGSQVPFVCSSVAPGGASILGSNIDVINSGMQTCCIDMLSNVGFVDSQYPNQSTFKSMTSCNIYYDADSVNLLATQFYLEYTNIVKGISLSKPGFLVSPSISSNADTTITISATPDSNTTLTETVVTTNGLPSYSVYTSSFPLTLSNLNPGTSYNVQVIPGNKRTGYYNNNNVALSSTTTGAVYAKDLSLSFGTSNQPIKINDYALQYTGTEVLGPIIDDQMRGFVANLSNSYYTVQAYSLPQSYTKMAWVYPDYAARNKHILSSTSTSSTDPMHKLMLNNSNILVAAHNTVGTGEIEVTGTQIPEYKWSHVCVTYNSSNTSLTMYVNGTVVASNNAYTAWSGGGGLHIGNYGTTAVGLSNFVGEMDEIKVYSYALTSNDIMTEIYNNKNVFFSVTDSNLITPQYGYTLSNASLGVTYFDYARGYVLDTMESNQRISVNNYSMPQSYTKMAWVYPGSNMGSNMPVLASSVNNANHRLGLNSNYCIMFSHNSSNVSTPIVVSTSNVVPMNTWSHLAASYDDTSKLLNIYLNGSNILASNYNVEWFGGGGLGIGYNSSNNNLFYGYLDELRVYDRKLSDNNVLSAYSNQSPILLDVTSSNLLSNVGAFSVINNGAVGISNDAQRGLVFDLRSKPSFIEIPKASFAPSYTKMMWIKGTDSNFTGVNYIMSSASNQFYIDKSGNYFTRHDGTSHSWHGTITQLVNNTTWFHLALSYNHLTKEITKYVNGTVHGSIQSYTPPSSYAEGIFIGNQSKTAATTSEFTGYINNIRIFDRPLSANKVVGYYTAPLEVNYGTSNTPTICSSNYYTLSNTNGVPSMCNDMARGWVLDQSSPTNNFFQTVLTNYRATPSYTKMIWMKLSQSNTHNFLSTGSACHQTFIDTSYRINVVHSTTASNVTTTNPIDPGVWTHVAVTYDEDTKILRTYRNGLLQTNTTSFLAPATTAINLCMGNINTSGTISNKLIGYIDNAVVYPYCMKAKDINKVFDTSFNRSFLIKFGSSNMPTTDTMGTVKLSSLNDGYPGIINDPTRGWVLDQSASNNAHFFVSTLNYSLPLSYTKMAWVHPTVSKQHYLLSSFVSHFVYIQPDGSLVATNNNYANQKVLANAGSVLPNKWTHIAVTYNNDTGLFKGFVNGLNTVTFSNYLVPPAVSSTVLIGNVNITTGYSVKFVGYMDEPAVYNSALSDAEILSMYTTSSNNPLQ